MFFGLWFGMFNQCLDCDRFEQLGKRESMVSVEDFDRDDLAVFGVVDNDAWGGFFAGFDRVLAKDEGNGVDFGVVEDFHSVFVGCAAVGVVEPGGEPIVGAIE